MHLKKQQLKSRREENMLQVRLELTTSASPAHILLYKYRALTDCATGAARVWGCGGVCERSHRPSLRGTRAAGPRAATPASAAPAPSPRCRPGSRTPTASPPSDCNWKAFGGRKVTLVQRTPCQAAGRVGALAGGPHPGEGGRLLGAARSPPGSLRPFLPGPPASSTFAAGLEPKNAGMPDSPHAFRELSFLRELQIYAGKAGNNVIVT